MHDSTDRTRPEPAAPPIPGFRLEYPQQTPALAFGADEPAPVKLSEKHRPKTLCDVFGQGSAICQLQSFLESPYPVAFVFEGPTGVGKTSTALALASELGVDPNWSLIHIKSGEQDGDAVMTALKTLRFSAVNGGWKMIVVDEADYMSDKCRNLWLSALEDLPGRSIVVFTTNHPEKFQDRFLDRCERITFRADAQTLSLDAESLVKHVWRSETGRDDHPALESLPNVVDKHGNVSFRRILSALEPLLRAARSAPTVPPVEPEPVPALPEPEPTPVPEFSDPEPVKASRSAESIIMEAIEARRASASVARIWDEELATAQRSAVTRRIKALVGPAIWDSKIDGGARLAMFAAMCVQGSPVTFPTPEPSDPTTTPEVAPDGTPDGTPEASNEADTPAPDFPRTITLDPVPALPDAQLADDDEPTDPEPTPGPDLPEDPATSALEGRARMARVGTAPHAPAPEFSGDTAPHGTAPHDASPYPGPDFPPSGDDADPSARYNADGRGAVNSPPILDTTGLGGPSHAVSRSYHTDRIQDGSGILALPSGDGRLRLESMEGQGEVGRDQRGLDPTQAAPCQEWTSEGISHRRADPISGDQEQDSQSASGHPDDVQGTTSTGDGRMPPQRGQDGQSTREPAMGHETGELPGHDSAREHDGGNKERPREADGIAGPIDPTISSIEGGSDQAGEGTRDQQSASETDPVEGILETPPRLTWEFHEFDSDGRIRRCWMRAIESGIRLTVESILSIGGYKPSLAWLLMEPLERRDFAEWLAFLDYQPGYDQYGRLAPDEAWVEFIRECREGSPIFPVTTKPLPPGGDDDDSRDRAGLEEARGATMGLEAGPVQGTMGTGPDLACVVGAVVPVVLPGAGAPPLPGPDCRRQDRMATMSPSGPAEGLPGFPSMVVLVHGLDQPVITSSTANLPESTDTPPGGFPNQEFHDDQLYAGRIHGLHDVRHAGLDDRIAPDDRAPARPDPGPHAATLTPPRSFLNLTIGNREYGLTIDGDTFTLETPHGQLYEVTRGDDSTCTCPDAVYRRNGLDAAGCRHQKALRDVGLLPPVPDFPEALPLPEWASDLDVSRFFGMAP